MHRLNPTRSGGGDTLLRPGANSSSSGRIRLAGRCALVIAFLAAAVPAAGPARAQERRAAPPYHDVRELPAGEEGRRIRELIDAINANDPARLRNFVQESFAPGFRDAFPMEDHVGVLMGAYEASHGYDFYGIRKYEGPGGPPGTVVIVSNRLTEGWEAFVIELEPGPPHRITGVEISPARPPKEVPAQNALRLDEAARELAGFVERLSEADAFSGSVLLAKDGKPVYLAAFGEAVKGYGVPNRTNTKFNLGSMNKMFTGVAVLQLAEKGKLALGDPLSKHLDPGWLPKVDLSKVRIEHLLTHTSGLGSYFNDTFMHSSRALYRAVEDYKPLLAGDTLAFEPGTSWQYSNTGFLLLGAVVEKASGVDYFEYVRRNVYAPAGMTDTDCFEMDAVVPNLAIGYTKEPGASGSEWRSNTFMHVIKGGPAGGGYSTAADLLRFGEALRAHKLLSEASTKLLWSPKPELGSESYGYGFGSFQGPLGRKVGHSGGFPGISADLSLYLDTGDTVVVLSNYGHAAEPVVRKAEELLARVAR